MGSTSGAVTTSVAMRSPFVIGAGIGPSYLMVAEVSSPRPKAVVTTTGSSTTSGTFDSAPTQTSARPTSAPAVSSFVVSNSRKPHFRMRSASTARVCAEGNPATTRTRRRSF